MKQTQWALRALQFACRTLAQAQWVWLNDKGGKELSDRPPPASVPLNRILKAPRGLMPDLRKELAEQPADETQKAPATRQKPTLAERNDDFARRRQENAEQTQKAAIEARNKAERAAGCADARANQRMLESGIRVTTADANGERVFLSEAQKAEQLKRTQQTLADCR